MFFLRLLSRLPLSVLYRIADFLFVVAYYLTGYRKRLVMDNLRRAFPEKSDAEIVALARKFYQHLCEFAVESVKLLSITPAELRRRVTFDNANVLLTHLQAGQSVLVLASHTFNWEWLLAAASIQLPAQVDFVYQAQRSKLANRFALAGRCRFGAYPIERFRVGRENLARRNITRVLALVADQYPGLGHDKKMVVEFLNRETAFFAAPQTFANATGFPVFYARMRRQARGYYMVQFDYLGNPPFPDEGSTLIYRYAKAIETMIRERPAEWLWSHNRWKTRHLTTASAAHPRA
jgi:KDO2-lipid IV(A) lauroyltransferase